MKHVFVVHSPITYLSALGVMATEKLEQRDCILVSEGFSREQPVPIHTLPYTRGLKANHYHLGRYLKPYKATDKHIARLTMGEPFVAYVSTVNKLARYLITNPLCCEFHFIEEGTSAYVPWIELYALTLHNSFVPMRPGSLMDRLRDLKLPLCRGYSSQISALPLFYNAYTHPRRKFYGFSPSSHCLVDERQRVLLDFRAINAAFSLPTTLTLDNSVVWIGDCVEIADRSIEQYLASIKNGLIDRVLTKEGIRSIFVKFHYRESELSRRVTLELFAAHNISVTVIDESTIMEVEFLATTTARVYSTYSSLLLYAALSGNAAYSVDRHYAGGLTNERLDFMWQYVQKI